MIRRAAGLTGVLLGTIYEAANGREAIGVLERHTVHVLFTDINMPVMNGTELLQAISQQERYRHLMRVIISSDGSAARRTEADQLHVRHYVGKPFRPEVMRDVLTDLTAHADVC
jgi:two-component system chemotaxis response regulator CheY